MSHLPGRSILVVSAFLLAVAMAAPSGAAAQQQAGDNSRPVTLDTVAPRAITLDEALELAKQNAPRAIAAAGSRRAADAAVRSAYGAFLPNLTLSAGATRQFPSRGGTRIENGQVVTLPAEPWSQNAGFTAGLTIFQGGRRLFELRQARALAAAGDVNEAAESYGVALDTKTRYYGVLAARDLLSAAESRRAQAKQGLDDALSRVRARTATRSDSLRAVIEFRNADLAVLDATQGIAITNAALTRAVGSIDLVTATDAETDDAVDLALDEAQIRALAPEGPSVERARTRRDAARAAASASWSSYLPSVTASYSRVGSGSGPSLDVGGNLENYSGSFRLSASLPLFDRFGREESVVRARVAAANAEAEWRDARLGARESLERSLGDFNTSRVRADVQRASVEAAEEDLRVQQERYRTGAGTLLDVLTSQSTLHEARLALIQARYDQRITKAELEALLGRDL
jgi:outer membrane protein